MASLKKIITDSDTEDDFVVKKNTVTKKIVKDVTDDKNITDDKDVKDEKDDPVVHTHSVERKECEVCCDLKIFLVQCPYCSYSACENCYQRVIVTSVTKPSCISCKKQFIDDFFYSNFSDSFIKKKYKKHREEILFKMEEALLPETQPHVERIKKREILKCEEMEIEMQIKALKEKQKEIKRKIQDTYNEIDSKDQEEKITMICPCPSSDCRGFLNSKYKCGICGIKACSECREIKKDKDHECNPDTVKTVEELKKNCRNCPNCMILIYKISGCDQMFCVKCKVAFNWVTGKIETGLIHNPHYFEWMRENGGIPRNPHERECGGLPDFRAFYDIKVLHNIQFINNEGNAVNSFVYITEKYREVLHIQEVTLQRLPTVMDNNNNLPMRIDYLMKKIDKDEFKRKLVRKEQDQTKMIEYRQIVEMYYNVTKDLFNKLIDDLSYDFSRDSKLVDVAKNIFVKFKEDEVKIREYTNECIEKLKKKYGSRFIYNI